MMKSKFFYENEILNYLDLKRGLIFRNISFNSVIIKEGSEVKDDTITIIYNEE